MKKEKIINWPGWETTKILGRGSFGAVYEIERNNFGNTEKAALKVITIPQEQQDIEELYSDGYDTESVTARFRSYLESIVHEYSLMAEMKGCANIVYCDDLRYIQHDDGIGWDIYIKMELLTPLMKALPARVEEAQVIQLGIDICNALVQCKSSNIVHRDIKPQNIFVSKDGHYKLGDFGVAKISEKTTSGTKVGTYKYMAPEVYKSEPYGAGSDIYSLGLVMYWLLNARRMPFLPLPPQVPTVSMEEASRLRRFSGEQLPAPAHGSKELQNIVLKACSYDPKDRYAGAADMMQALKNLGEDTDEGTVGIFGGRESKQKEQELLRREQEERERLRKEQEERERLRREREELEQLRREREEQDILRREQEEQARLNNQQRKKQYLLIGGCVGLALLILIGIMSGSGATSEPIATDAPPESISITIADVYSDVVMDKEFDTHYCYHVPAFRLSSGAEEKINKTIYDFCSEVLQEEVYGDFLSSAGMHYAWGQKGNMASVIIKTDNRSWEWTDYYVYTIDAETGETLSDIQLLDAFSMTTEEFREKLRRRLQEYWDGRTDIIEWTGKDLYEEVVSKTLSDEYIGKAHPYINSQGELGCVALIASPAGGEYYYHLIGFSGEIIVDDPHCTLSHLAEITELTPTVEPVYINELNYYTKYGKVYYHDNQNVSYENNKDWRDLSTPGHIQQLVRDANGNTFTYGIHMDGDQLGPYYISYDLAGEYTTFSGWCILPDYKAGTSDAKEYSKYFEVYCDGKLVFTSNIIKNGSTSQYFEIDVTSVEVLTVQYPPTTGPNDLAVLCDGLLS